MFIESGHINIDHYDDNNKMDNITMGEKEMKLIISY